MTDYGWVIDKDLIDDGMSNGVMGPSRISNYIITLLKHGKGRPFRMYDDDGELYFEGRAIALYDDTYLFSPLWDFGEPDSGCTEIKYLNDEHEWVTL